MYVCTYIYTVIRRSKTIQRDSRSKAVATNGDGLLDILEEF